MTIPDGAERKRPMKRLFFSLIISLFILPGPKSSTAAENDIYVIPVAGSINPGVADFIKTGIEQAATDNVGCIIIELDTPGGLADAMRDIVMAMLGSDIPVVVYVSPSGARAASAGVMITMAADIAAMSPGTNIGAAHPVGLGGKEIAETATEKATNDMVAHARSVAEKKGRNAEWVEKAIRESVSVTETEALQQNIIDIVAKNREDLIEQINGREVADKGVLNLDNYTITVIKEHLRTKILKTISDPNIAYILMMIGLAGLYFELAHPGAIFPGVVGAISLILAFFAFQTLPVNYAGILLIILAIVLFILEMKITSYGLLSIAGVISLILGSLMLFEGSSPEISISIKILLPTILLISGFFIVVASLVFKSQVARPRTGASGLLDEIGVVKKEISPDGKVFVHGELWNATATVQIEEGTRVKVVKVNNLVLEVTPVT